MNNIFLMNWSEYSSCLRHFILLFGIPQIKICGYKIFLADGSDKINSIMDNHSGMSETTKAKIFQPFITTKPTRQGTGLGLSLAYDIVTKGHGDTLEVNSTKGIGSEFIVTLPFKTIE